MNSGTNLVFVDTNVLVYAHDLDEGQKHDIAVAVLNKLWRDGTGVLSTQVLQEFYRVATRKMNPAMTKSEARAIIAEYGQWCSMDTNPQLLVSASILDERYQLPWWDALVVEGAVRSGASLLLSDDLQNGQRFGTLTVRNPFVGP
ncbi:MAG TPA: PIN domain-containing protein [Actinophytocola sp.]|uniref:PIN domain-containing protein n=1 Tax=Actinophytocola sp. TaxID=1872138 RepID=UPI002DBA8D62|nr:PIN domain-containing protein [Actinophytocola sp.]HEU5472105.1 PIN domain-containing protein [Actinophytocola sp.]